MDKQSRKRGDDVKTARMRRIEAKETLNAAPEATNKDIWSTSLPDNRSAYPADRAAFCLEHHRNEGLPLTS